MRKQKEVTAVADRCLSVEEVADFLGDSEKTVYTYMKGVTLSNGTTVVRLAHFKPRKDIKVRQSELEAFIQTLTDDRMKAVAQEVEAGNAAS